jgi:O-antigen ligase
MFRSLGDGVAFLFFINYFFVSNKVELFLASMCFVAWITASANLASILLFPKGLYKISGDMSPYSLFGHKNLAGTLSFTLTIFIIIQHLRKTHKNDLFIAILFGINLSIAIVINSTTTIVAESIFILFYYFFPSKWFRRAYTVALVASIGISVVLTTSSIILTQIPIVSNLIVNVLGKDLTFTNRTYIWARVYQILVGNGTYLLGRGFETGEVTRQLLRVAHAHNGWLSFAYRGGILLVASMLAFSWITARRLEKSPHAATPIGKLLGSVFVYYMVWFLTDTQDGSTVLYMFFIFNYMILNIDMLVPAPSTLPLLATVRRQRKLSLVAPRQRLISDLTSNK